MYVCVSLGVAGGAAEEPVTDMNVNVCVSVRRWFMCVCRGWFPFLVRLAADCD